MNKKPGGVAGSYVDGFFVKSDEVTAEGAKLQPKEVFRGARIYVLGGGCYGMQYATRLLLARDRINFEKIVVVDESRSCVVSKKLKNPLVEIDISEWTDFLSAYIDKSPIETEDLFVPSHAAPHLLGKAFFKLIGEHSIGNKKASIELVSVKQRIKTPFEKSLENGVISASMAEWTCPANCTEPLMCPHIRKPRDWDLVKLFLRWSEECNMDAFYIFFVRHFTNEVSVVKFGEVVRAWRLLSGLLSKSGEYIVGVATASFCHGITSIFKVTA